MARVAPRRDHGAPPGPPRPVAVTFGTPEDRARWERQRFIEYVLVTDRIGRGDLQADDG